MIGYVGDKINDITIDLYGDADFAGCKETSRSTPGVFQQMNGQITKIPLAGVAKRQPAVSYSTPEAEIVAFCYAIRMEGLPMMDLMQAITGRDPTMRFFEDNTATIRILETGKTNSLRHLLRTHRVCFQWYHECHKRKLFTIHYCQSNRQAADIFTKMSHTNQTWNDCLKLINIHTIGDNPPLNSFKGEGATLVDRSTGIKVEKKRKKIRRPKMTAKNKAKATAIDGDSVENDVTNE